MGYNSSGLWSLVGFFPLIFFETLYVLVWVALPAASVSIRLGKS